MTRDALIDILWALKPELLFVTKEQFVAALDGWEIDPREIDGELAFIFLTKGPELHFTTLDTGRSMPKAMARDVLQRIIDRHGYVTVKTPKLEERQQRFNRAIGFREVGEDHYDVHFRMDRFGRGACQYSQ